MNRVRIKTGKTYFWKLIPYESFTVFTNCDKATLASRLAEQVRSHHKGGFRGEVYESGFSVRPVSPWYISNPLPPSLAGLFREEGKTAIIEIKVFNPFHVALTVTGYILVCAFFLAGTLSFLGSGVQPVPLAAYLVSMGTLAMILLANWEFFSGNRKTKQEFLSVLGLNADSKDIGEFLCPSCGYPVQYGEEACSKCGWSYKVEKV